MNSIKTKFRQYIRVCVCHNDKTPTLELLLKNKNVWNGSLPHVRHGGEDAVFEGFWRHPAHRQQSLPTLSVVICLVNVPRHAKIYKARTNEVRFHTFYIAKPVEQPNKTRSL